MGYPSWQILHESNPTLQMPAKSKGTLLLAHWGIDENVNPSATF